MKNRSFIFLVVCMFFSLYGQSQTTYPNYEELEKSMTKRLIEYTKSHDVQDINELRKNFMNTINKDNRIYGITNLPAKRREVLEPEDIYAKCLPGVFVYGMAKWNEQTKEPEASFVATAFALTEDGLCATNFHVLADVIFSGAVEYYWPNDYLRFIMDHTGKIFPVTEVLAAENPSDYAIFRVDVGDDKLVPIPLGDPATTGAIAYCLANPQANLFYFTNGMVSRNVARRFNQDMGTPFVDMMQITADYSFGSSGGPILDKYGNVIGMVSTIGSLYDNPQAKTNFHMTIHNTVPVKDIKAVFVDGNKPKEVIPDTSRFLTKLPTEELPHVEYGIRYKFYYKFDKERDELYMEDMITLVAPEMTQYKSYFQIGHQRQMKNAANNPEANKGMPVQHVDYIYRDTPHSFYYNSKSKKMQEAYWLLSERFMWNTPTPKIKWKVSKETKQIGKYNCTKAVGEFAGRSYTAWFTTDLPYTAAPWKLIGLPGVVLEAEDSTGDIRFEFKDYVTFEETRKIEYPSNLSHLPKKNFNYLRELFGKTDHHFYTVAGLMNRDQKGPDIGFPATSLDLCPITNPMELK